VSIILLILSFTLILLVEWLHNRNRSTHVAN
jgi:hypothetical protein